MIELQSNFIELSTGATFHYLDSGGADKPVMVALQGRMGMPEIDMPQIIDWLSPDYRFIAPSLRGYGQSTPKPRSYPIGFYQRDARDVVAFIEALNIAPVHLLGYSDGGEVALLTAAYQPMLIKSLAVWGAVGYYGPEMRPWVQRNYPGTWITEDDKRIHGITEPDKLALEWVTACKFIIDSGGDLSLSLAEKITAPLLLMLGDQDHLNPIAYGQKLVDRAPQGRLEVFQSGHGIHEQQWEQFQAVVGAFLTSPDSSGASHTK